MPRKITCDGLDILGMPALVAAIDAVAEGRTPEVGQLGTELFELQVYIQAVTNLIWRVQRLRLTQAEAAEMTGLTAEELADCARSHAMDDVVRQCERASEKLLPITRRSAPCGS